jgi:ABC-type multidrug transport system fused ATPase/permease subunit
VTCRDVTFTYPTSQSTRPAIANVSITLGAGQLVVIVGANGSGKTSLVKLLTRLHNPSSGEILIDGVRANEYRVQDLRQAISLLSQDHALFPLSIKEDIALGRPYAPDVHGEPAIAEAARKGGAEGFINKFTHKYDTVLDPVGTKGAVGLHPQHPIMKLYAKLEKTTEVSGGERQRLVAARTFMRITDEKIKLVIVDEPSAAMDPEGEYELFKHLREARAGRTMVFITHRFGHLTKHADLIL